jgi:hypothetical protein
VYNSDTAIIVFAYNRPTHITRLLKSLLADEKVSNYHVIVFQDGPKNYQDIVGVEETFANISGLLENFASFEFHRNTENQGLAKSIIKGVTYGFLRFDKCIILEDDIVVSSNFLTFMQNNLDLHSNNEAIGSITGYKLVSRLWRSKSNVYLSRRHSSWGWGTWKKTWESVNWEILEDFNSKENKKIISMGGDDLMGMIDLQRRGLIDSWSIVFDVNMLLRGLFCIYPVQEFCINMGMDGSGTHYSSERQNKVSKFRVASSTNRISISAPKLSRLYNLQVKMMYSKFRFNHISIALRLRHLLRLILIWSKNPNRRLQ